jgi:hypothetical protein
MQFGQLATEGGYLNSECTSAMQKCIRRGLEEEALFWATELDLAGYGASSRRSIKPSPRPHKNIVTIERNERSEGNPMSPLYG